MDTSADTEPTSEAPAPIRRMSLFRALQTVISVAILIATLFTVWTPAGLFSNNLIKRMNFVVLQPGEAPPQPGVLPSPTPRPAPRIGLVSGHMGNDSGSVCPDGLTEAEVNLKIATLVKQDLSSAGYEVDLLKEFDSKLYGYQALVLVSIHNDSCDFINDEATGFKVSAAKSSTYPERASRLTSCLVDRYAATTKMVFHYNSITRDMTEYHAFNEIDANTTAAIIETGFLNLDRKILTEHTDLVAKGVSAGILCFVRNENVVSTPTSSNP
ncbi:MAG TPA: N-acetylmuramoyl-L-alanine amidase [Anaerolineaceae bacterium]|nr:N-acetylmuramoyl-L-alanine amidase [Anaerolineaceae bacterium]